VRPPPVFVHRALCVDTFTFTSFTQLGGPQTPFTFDGDAVAIYGTVSPLNANYTVTVDGVKQDFLGGSNGLTSDRHEGVRALNFLYGGTDSRFIACRLCWSVKTYNPDLTSS
jgi:hypothetical protein